jgi:hypothetical protein
MLTRGNYNGNDNDVEERLNIVLSLLGGDSYDDFEYSDHTQNPFHANDFSGAGIVNKYLQLDIDNVHSNYDDANDNYDDFKDSETKKSPDAFMPMMSMLKKYSIVGDVHSNYDNAYDSFDDYDTQNLPCNYSNEAKIFNKYFQLSIADVYSNNTNSNHSYDNYDDENANDEKSPQVG